MTSTALPGRPAVRRVRVVVPAHDEAEDVGACLASLTAAAETLRHAAPALDVAVLLVLDRCTDRTPAIAGTHPVTTLTVDLGSVGGARAAGVAAVVAEARRDGVGTEAVLVVNTDADCVVPRDWLVDHVGLAADHDLVQGEVVPDPTGLSEHAQHTWASRHPAGRGSLHGANLGFRLDAYLAAGGFPAVTEQEDLLLVRAMKAAGAAATGGTCVLTSSRRDGRTPGGFAAYLRGLDTELGPEPGPA